MRAVMMKCMNFSVDRSMVEGNSGFLINDSWTGALGKLAEDRFDIIIEHFIMTSSRRIAFYFPNVGYSADMYLYVRKPDTFPVSWLVNFRVLKIENK